MAFVFRTENQPNISKTLTPGPGAYLNKKSKISQKQQQSRAPFNNTSNRQIWKKNIIPGPGSYQTQSFAKKQKKLLSDPFSQILIYQSPKPSVSFKSKTMRFEKNQTTCNPGPGQYDLQVKQKKTLYHEKKQSHSSNELKDFLKQKNKLYRKQFQDEQLQKEMVISANQNKEIQSYEINQRQEFQNTKKSTKNSIFFTSKVQRQPIRIRPQTSAGPGSYNLAKSPFQVKKTQNRKKATKSICFQRKIGKVQVEELGPGYYDVQKAFKKLNKPIQKIKKFECFGSTVDRFKSLQNIPSNIFPGPASYETINNSTKNNGRKKMPTNTLPRCQRKIFQGQNNNFVSPWTYEAYNDFSTLVKDKYKRKSCTKRSFGSNKQRFIQQNNRQSSPDFLVYQPDLCLVDQNVKKQKQPYGKQRKSFKNLLKVNKRKPNLVISNVYSDIQENKQNQNSYRPLCYDNQSHTLSAKYGRKKQIQAPFMSGAQRFNNQSDVKFIDLQPKNVVCNKKNEQKIQQKGIQKNKGSVIVNKDKRFKYNDKKDEELGPQFYNPVLPGKKSYNVIFA